MDIAKTFLETSNRLVSTLRGAPSYHQKHPITRFDNVFGLAKITLDYKVKAWYMLIQS
jgi:hypothetical protein